MVARSDFRNENCPAEALIIMAGHDWHKPHEHRRRSHGVCTSKLAPAARRQAVCPMVARSAFRNESCPAEALIIMAGHDWSKPHQHRSSRGVRTSKFAGCPPAGGLSGGPVRLQE